MPTIHVGLHRQGPAQMPFRSARDWGREDPVHLEAKAARPLAREAGLVGAGRVLVRLQVAVPEDSESGPCLAPQHSGHRRGPTHLQGYH